jgi:putative transposase
MYKALQHGKIVEIVGAHHTTKTCSSCGNNQTMALTDRVYECKSCSRVLDRDFNAGKNILMKGLLV